MSEAMRSSVENNEGPYLPAYSQGMRMEEMRAPFDVCSAPPALVLRHAQANPELG